MTTGWVINNDFSDDFNTFNTSKWHVIGGLNNMDIRCHDMSPDAYFSNEEGNVTVSNGKLKLQVFERESVECTYSGPNGTVTKDYHYSSGWVESNNTFHYGYVEIRCKLPSEIALNPCFWMTGYIGNPMTAYDEIDVFEKSIADPSNTMLMQNFYIDTDLPTWSTHCQKLEFNQSYVGIEYVYSVEWLPEEIHFYINGNHTSSIKYTTNPNYYNSPYPDVSYYTCADIRYAVPQHFLITLSLNLTANPNPFLTQYFEIEYIKSYKLMAGNLNEEYWPMNFSMSDQNIFKVHKSIKLGGSGRTAVIPSGANLTLWGKDSVVFKQGFTLNTGTEFVARTIKTHTDLFQ
jgi:hypothetical protein